MTVGAGVSYPAAGGPVDSAAYPPTQPGTYRWVARYGGDANNNPAAGACGDPAETVVVAAPSVVQVPTLGPWGAALLAAGLGLAGWRRRRAFAPPRRS